MGSLLWNLFLAAIPAALALALFTLPIRRGVAWWAGFTGWWAYRVIATYVGVVATVALGDKAIARARRVL